MSANELRERMRTEGFDPGAWSNGPGDRYGVHEHDYDKVIVVASGSIEFGLPQTGGGIRLAVGDRLELPAWTSHEATVGPDGVTCLEAHVPSGSLAGGPRRIGADAW
jgi:hypothetical protein